MTEPRAEPGIPPPPSERESSWRPLSRPLFRAFWIANQFSFFGTWIQQVGAAWLMTELAPHPVMVALVQSATGLAMFLLVVPVGAAADILDRRRMLLGAQVWMLAAAVALGVLTIAGGTTPWLLLGLTFLLAAGAALSAPTWHALLPELVEPRDLPAAIALNSMGVNLARAVGPAIGGLVVAAMGTGAAFLLNGLSFAGLIWVAARWRREAELRELPDERLLAAVRSGLRYVRHSPRLTAVLVRTGLFVLAGSAFWALLPLLARESLGLSAAGYGALLGFFGSGAVTAALLLARLRRLLAVDGLVAAATLAYGLGLVTIGLVELFPVVALASFVNGMSWLLLLASFNTAAQTVLPSWVRARGMSIYLLVFFGGMTAGSVLWGAVAGRIGLGGAAVAAGVAAAAGLAARLRYRIVAGEGLNLAPSRHWPAPALAEPIDPDRGPVLVAVEYRVAPADQAAFEGAMQEMRRLRRRDGAYFWELFVDAADPTRYQEVFLVDSWLEHLRQHQRVTEADREIESRVHELLEAGRPQRVTHLISVQGMRRVGEAERTDPDLD